MQILLPKLVGQRNRKRKVPLHSPTLAIPKSLPRIARDTVCNQRLQNSPNIFRSSRDGFIPSRAKEKSCSAKAVGLIAVFCARATGFSRLRQGLLKNRNPASNLRRDRASGILVCPLGKSSVDRK
jgi:hypothetical protein